MRPASSLVWLNVNFITKLVDYFSLTVYVCVSNIQPKTSAPRLSGIAEYYSRGGKLKNVLLIMM